MPAPTRSQLFCASNWPARIWFVAFPAIAVWLMAAALGPAPDLSAWNRDAKGYALLIVVALFLGLAIGGLLGVFVLGPVYFHRSQLNGAPYGPGDRVMVLVGRNRGLVARIVEVNDFRDTIKVEWEDSAADAAKVYYRHLQVLRADARPPAATSPAIPAP